MSLTCYFGGDMVVECVRCDQTFALTHDQAHLIGSAVCPDCARNDLEERLEEEDDA